ncbi:histidine kinase [Paenibacillus sp. 32O-W]|uniref:cache domain-containing sensor histidine kinase n=1 Tax=Paenibacillus sp. 32O-W TaxID=1695218 RepID=UPI000720074D|nr:sensor histidine kinase [Paenibacillus sp. 32O-W]ALS29903.1 histidine kinase [Paenibacillus sp. 32O-W]
MMRLGAVIRRMLSQLRIQTKLLFAFLALIAISAGAVSAIVYRNTVESMERRVEQSTEQAINQAYSFLSYKLNNIKDVSSMLFMHDELNDILNRGRYGLRLGDQIDDYNKILNILNSVQSGREIYRIRLYVDSTNIYAREKSTIFALGTIRNEPWYGEMLHNSDGIYCRSPYEDEYGRTGAKRNIISCVRPMRTEQFTGEVMGVLSLEILEETFRQIIEETQNTTTGKVYLADRTNRIISSTDEAGNGTVVPLVDLDSHIVIEKPIDGTSWKLIAHIPKSEIYAEVRQWSNELYLVLSVVIVVGILAAVAFSHGLTRRIKLLLQQIKMIESENWDSQTDVTTHDEIGVLQSHLNQMSENIRVMIQEKYKTETQKKAAELQALQAQINPHFLYNTLDLIHWMAMERGAREISEVAVQLSSFFRISLSQGRDIIPIADELEHVRTYLDIQNRRFGGNIRYTIDASPEALAFKTVKLVLQPIVENAVLHGIREKLGKSGEIAVRCRMHGDVIEFTVEDNGVGMTEEQMRRLADDSSGAGYGIKNVKEKLALYFGEEAAVSFERADPEGTRVRIRIPATDRDVRPDEQLYREANKRNQPSI